MAELVGILKYQMASTSASCSSVDSNSTQSYRYDVFISFRGTDTRNTFVDHLYAHLIRKGIFAFKDDQLLQKGESISPQLLQAIQHSRVSIVVFSKDYAASTWCLDEMATIAECCTELKQPVFPVFYDVNPSHVRKQNGVYESVFVLHTEQFKHEPGKVDRWKSAMTCLAGSAGWDVRNKPEFVQVESIVQAVIKRLGHRFSGFADDLIGIQPRVEALESILRLSSEDDGFRVLGIWGMGGIGKTTLASILYDRISYRFDACCLIENVSKIYRDGAAIAVQKQILRRAIEEKNLEEYSPSEISGIVSNRLHNIKLLVVLDDVDKFAQLHELHINPKLLHAGSRLIITTRDERILKEYGADMVYEAQLMNDNDAHELLCRKAFKSDYSSSTFAELIPEVLKYAQCLPLAIRVMGSFLWSRNATQWIATLDGLRNNPDKRIMKVLQISFEGLEQREREIFLHVACFFKGERVDYVRRILDACGLHPHIGIPLIAEKSLIAIRNQEIHMHEMLQELGKQIVRGQHPNEPGFWSRLWLYQDFHRVMMTNTGSIEVKAIVLDQKEDGFNFNKLRAEDLSKMGQLKLLILYHKNFSGSPISISNSLCYLSWNGCPFTSLPLDFRPFDLVELNMPNSNVEKLWTGIQEPRHFRCGFDIVLPWHCKNIDFHENPTIPQWFDHRFNGGSIMRIKRCNMDVDWLGFVFCVAFEVNSRPTVSGSLHHLLSSLLPYPFYLSFESEHTEERFDMPLSLELNKVDGSNYLWTIYISRQHCHFVNTGARITFKACHGLVMKEWGMHVLTKESIPKVKLKERPPLIIPHVQVEYKEVPEWLRIKLTDIERLNSFSGRKHLPLVEVIDNVEESSNNFEPKIQLPYNWLVSEEDEVENDKTKRKEINLSSLGL